MRPPATRPRLRKREIVLAVGAGVLATGVAAGILSDDNGGGPQVAVSGPTERTYAVAPFTEISTTGPQDLVVTRGDTLSVRAEGSPDAIALLEAVVEDGELIIRPKGSNSFNWGRDWSRLASTFYITVPDLQAVSLAGSGSVRVDRIEGDEFEGTIAGSGDLSIEAMTVDEVDFKIGGSGTVSAAGTAREMSVSIGGSGEVMGSGLASRTASVSIGGSGNVGLTVAEQADVSIAGSGDVQISGGARCSVTSMGSGEVSCDNPAQ